MWFYFCNIIFASKFFALQLFVSANICTFIFDRKENNPRQNKCAKFCDAKNVDAKFLVAKKNACKNKSSKIFDYLVRVHNDKGLELCGREGTGKVQNWNFKTKASGCTAAYSKVPARLWDLSLGWEMKVHSPVPSRSHNSNPLSLWTRTK